MRSSYFLLFTLAAILPGLMLGAVLSRATSGTAAGARSIEAPAWPAPLEARVAEAPGTSQGQRRSEFGTKDADGSSQELALALLDAQGEEGLRDLIPSAPEQPFAVQQRPQAATRTSLASAPDLPAPNLPAPDLPAPEMEGAALRPEPQASLPAIPSGLPAPLKLEPLSLSTVKPVQPLDTKQPDRQPQPVNPSALALPSLPTLTPNSPVAAPNLTEPKKQVASLQPRSADLPAVDAPELQAAGSTRFGTAKTAADQVVSFNPRDPQSWLAGIETPGYRPPQFVLLSFEAASRNVFWDTSQELAESAEAQVTYFVSASSLMLASRADSYTAPTGESGRAWLGFAKDREELAGRLQRIQQALEQGHDVAVQGVGYHRGQGWSVEQWQKELSQTQAIVRGAYRDNGLSEPANWQALADRLLSGFRAREQSGSASLDAALQDWDGLRYNASSKQATAQWPSQEQGVWRFGLPMLGLDGGRRVLAQDYDFYLKQTNGQPNSAKSADHEEQMLHLLLAELDQRYQAGRAPMLVSLHFALWNKGAYWRAVKRFAKRVCDKPEVVCTTHAALASYLDAVGEAKLARLSTADFPRFAGAGLSLEAPHALVSLPQIASRDKDEELRADRRGLDAANDQVASATAARLLDDEPAAVGSALMAQGYVFDRLPQGLSAPLPPRKPRRIASLPAPAPNKPKVPASTPKPPAISVQQAEKPLPLPFAATSPTTGTRSANSDALY